MELGGFPRFAWLLLLFAASADVSRVDPAVELQRQRKLKEARALLNAAIPELRAAGDSRQLARALRVSAQISVSLDGYRPAIAEPTEALGLHRTLKDETGFAEESEFEVYGLLMGVDLVTVSACDTARGKIVGGEGMEAFSRAFLAAGASATVITPWRVAMGRRPISCSSFITIWRAESRRRMPCARPSCNSLRGTAGGYGCGRAGALGMRGRARS